MLASLSGSADAPGRVFVDQLDAGGMLPNASSGLPLVPTWICATAEKLAAHRVPRIRKALSFLRSWFRIKVLGCCFTRHFVVAPKYSLSVMRSEEHTSELQSR